MSSNHPQECLDLVQGGSVMGLELASAMGMEWAAVMGLEWALVLLFQLVLDEEEVQEAN